MHRREIERLIGKTQEKGLTLVPTRIYFSGPHVKVELALARGKEQRDKRETIREREQSREMERALRDRNRSRRRRAAPQGVGPGGWTPVLVPPGQRKPADGGADIYRDPSQLNELQPGRRIRLPLRCAAVSLFRGPVAH